MTPTALALSPHLDDAVFSCGGTLAMLARAGWHVVVATVFTQSVPEPKGFALACQLDKGLGPEVDYMALRRAEDAAALTALGVAAPVHLAFPEAPHRGYDSAAALFGPIVPCDDIEALLRAAIDGLLDTHAPDLVLAPQAIGGHVDHVQVVRALDPGARPVLWWRDFPYVTRTTSPAEPFRTMMDNLPDHAILLDAAAENARYAASSAYASQIGFQFGGLERLGVKLADGGGVERLRGEWPKGLALPLVA